MEYQGKAFWEEEAACTKARDRRKPSYGPWEELKGAGEAEQLKGIMD